ncbi:MAG TPA: GNAT family N-acetyltransferase [Streptosporangiaceae bacterium]|nr:GNAT family N-acetyltransferase [Streptosporangiaceae bacterium]
MTSSTVYALLADGTTVEIRPAGPGDYDAVKAMHQAMSPDNTYMRFFNVSRLSAENEARRVCLDPRPGQASLLALAGGKVAGVASYIPLRGHPEQAEVAFAVADDMHHRGIATLLLEHLVSYARSHGITTFSAETLTENKAMLGVFADAGLPVRRRFAEGVYQLTFPLPSQVAGTTLDGYLNAVAARERRADAASLRRVFAPESVAVIGASRRHGTVGRAILDNIRAAGYAGRLYTVNPHAARIDGQIDGERCLASVTDLPDGVDLAVIAVRAAGVLDVAEQCGQRGVRSLVVISAGLDAAAQAVLLATCRRYGMRLIGPDSFGVAVPGLGLDATFAARPAQPGVAGLVMQSGGLGFAMVDHLTRLGIGISSFASVGDKLDVSSNDVLLWWEQDGVTRLAVLYIESFGNPRKFARTARRVSAAMPVLTVLADRSDTTTREALFEQAGVVATRGFGELIQATALLATQPAPAGRGVAIVSNVGSAGTLAADACADLGLTARAVVDTTAPVSAADFRRHLEAVAAAGEVDAIVAIVLPTGATGDLAAAITAADTRGRPVAAVVLTQPESVRMLDPAPDGPGRRIPAYGGPEIAVRALARAAAYGAWRAEPRGRVPRFPDVRTSDARALVQAALPGGPAELAGSAGPGGPVWLSPEQAAALLRCYGLPLADLPPAGTELTVRVTDDHMFGSLVTLSPPGSGPGAARLTPLTDRDADRLTAAAGLPGPGTPGAHGVHAPLADLLLRVGRLADELPEVTELELSPVVAGPDGVAVVNARVRVGPYQPQDPFLRRLR